MKKNPWLRLMIALVAFALLLGGFFLLRGGPMERARKLSSSRQVEDWEKAAQIYSKEIETLLLAHRQAGYLQGKLGYELMRQQQFTKAADHLKKAIEYYPADPKLHLYLATCYANLAGMEEKGRAASDFALTARKEYERAIALADRAYLDEAEYGLASLLYYHFAENEQAKRHLFRAIERQPQKPEPRILMGRILADEEEFNAARDQYLKAYNLLPASDPRVSDVAYSLGVLSARLGRMDEAVEYLERAETLNPDLPGLKEKLAAAKRMREGAR